MVFNITASLLSSASSFAACSRYFADSIPYFNLPPVYIGNEAFAIPYTILVTLGVPGGAPPCVPFKTMVGCMGTYAYEPLTLKSGKRFSLASSIAAVASLILAWLFFSKWLFVMLRSIASFKVIFLVLSCACTDCMLNRHHT